jgi:hypothetical protein
MAAGATGDERPRILPTMGEVRDHAEEAARKT